MAMAHPGEGFVVWLTGLSGSGKTTLAGLLEKEVSARGLEVEVLDGDAFRAHLGRELGFTRRDRDTNVRRIGYLCQVLKRHRIVTIVAAISPYRNVRDELRAGCEGRFVEVYVKCPLEVLMQRDSKGLYRKAVAGEIQNFTGISDPYEEPLHPEIVVETDWQPPEESRRIIMMTLERLGYL